MEKILNSALIINKSDEKTHKHIKFNIDKDAKILKLEFTYSPKVVKEEEHIINAFKNNNYILTSEEISVLKDKFLNGEEELKNLATLSLYYGNEYIGCAHRQSEKQIIIISPEESTAGFINAKVKAGQWEIVISLHAVFADNMKVFTNVYIE